VSAISDARTSGRDPGAPPNSDAARRDAVLHFLSLSARLLLEYSARATVVERSIQRIARHLGVQVQTLVGYREATLSLGNGRATHPHAPELRINVAVGVVTLNVIDELCQDRLGLEQATRTLEAVERDSPRHPRWLVVLLFGLGGSAIAWLLRADWGAIVVSGVCSSAGLIARQELAKRSIVLFAHPFTAGLIGALIGSAAIRLGWTETSGLCLVVPALMLVPGPHFLNGFHDILENQMHAGLGRLALAVGLLVAAAFGVVLGARLVLDPPALSTSVSQAISLTLPLDMALAGVAAAGFGALYNAPWRLLWVSVVCGMVGHGFRYVALDALGVEIATLVACLCIGVIANLAAERLRLPFAPVAFAGAVPMMPGIFMYQSIAGAMRLAAAGPTADPAIAAATLALAFKSVFVVGAMTLGLLVGAWLAGLVLRAD
jgi:uncharacterized membrane protein YjjP (DUF1212 family)